MKKATVYILTTICAIMLCGCSNNETPPLSRERTQLIQRLFESLQKNDRNGSIARAEKLQKLAPDNNYLSHVLETQTANTYISHAQKALNDGHEKLALEILQKGLSKHPLNRALQTEYNNLKMLLDIEEALKKNEFNLIPAKLKDVPVHGPVLVKKMQGKNIPLEKKD